MATVVLEVAVLGDAIRMEMPDHRYVAARAELVAARWEGWLVEAALLLAALPAGPGPTITRPCAAQAVRTPEAFYQAVATCHRVDGIPWRIRFDWHFPGGRTIAKPNLTCRVFAGTSNVMRCVFVVAITRVFCGLAASLMAGLCSSAVAEEVNAVRPPELLTNLFQLRRSAEERPLVLPDFRIVADVLGVDSAAGVVALRDPSGLEFIQLDLGGRRIDAGTTVCLEGTGCRARKEGFGLAMVPGLVVDNDGIHGMLPEAGATFLRAGRNPIAVQWFNHLGELGLKVEYEGPSLPLQSIPSSVLSRTHVEPATGATNLSAGLDFRCYEGGYVRLPVFTK
ncbi:MAG TPA: hypothetical protein VL970_06570, partial [Candidatus Acidoferrales bacterium]|nr:hypothetical protein [Candidatus Acidoferrales bacterium]